MRLFFFGTLMDADVRRAVVGRDVAVEPAVMAGVRRVHVAGRDYPMLVPHPGGRVEGYLSVSLDEEAVRRLCRYEGPEYRLEPVTVRVGEVMVEAMGFICHAGVVPDRRPWRLIDWQRRHKRVFVRRTRDLMARAPLGPRAGIAAAAEG